MRATTAMNGRDGLGAERRQCASERPVGEITASRLAALLEYQEFRCALTGRKLTPDNAEADHIVPVKKGGANVMENVQIVTHQANRAKGTMGMDDFVRLCRDVSSLHGK